MNRFVNVVMAVAITCFASTAVAQLPPIDACANCVLGLYDDPGRTSSTGSSTVGQVKSIYLGIDFAAPEDRFTGFEFSIHGMRADAHGILLVNTQWLTTTQPLLFLGSIHAPADTTSGTGGLNVAWPTCVVGSQTLARLDILHFAPVVNRVMTVKRRYPTSNPVYGISPVFTRCDTPFFTALKLAGNCYILNWDGDPTVAACLDGPVGVEPRNWSGLKSLYR